MELGAIMATGAHSIRGGGKGTSKVSGDTSTHNGYLHRSKINLDLDPGTRGRDQPRPPPALTMHPSGRRLDGVEASLGSIRARGVHPKPFVASGVNMSSKATKENKYLPNTKHWSSFRDQSSNDNKYDDFEDNKTKGFGNLSK